MAFKDDLKQLWDAFKKTPTPVKLAVLGAAGVAGYLVISHSSSSSSTQQSASDAIDNASQTPTQGPFPEIGSGTSSVPYLPAGVNPVYDPSGNLVAFQPGGSSSPPGGSSSGVSTTGTSATGATTGSTSVAGLPVGVWLGPTGVLHYTVSSPQSINQIAKQFGVSGQSLGAIPANIQAYPHQTYNGNMPLPAGSIITLPGSVAKKAG